MKKILVTSFCLLSLSLQLVHAAKMTRMTHDRKMKTSDSQAKGSNADVAITQKIRNRLTEMEDLSMRAKNITIVTDGRDVTLKGEVEKGEEIQKILNIAKEEASGRQISNQLTVHQ